MANINRHKGNQDLVNLVQSRSTGKSYNGLRNQGATCYLNSVLQCLYMTEEFREELEKIRSDPQNFDERSTSLTLELQKLFEKMKQVEGTTEGITQSLCISNVWEQQDAVEYFQKILKAIGPHVSKAFEGKMNNKIKCSNNHIFQEQCDFYTIPFPIEAVHSGVFEVEKGLQMFFESCMLDEDNWLYCDDCHQKSETETWNEIEEFPTILSLYPKRFYFDYSQWRPVKNQCPIYVPRKLKICNIKYRLYAFINHSGAESGGHYNAVIKSLDDGKWYCFNDSYVKEDSEHFDHMEDGFISEEAYLLMYRKVDGLDPDEKSTSEILLCQKYCELVAKLLEWIHKYVSVFEEIKGTTHNEEIENVFHQFLQELPEMEILINHSKHDYNGFKDALQSGQFSIPPGYKPTDVEKEWHQLHEAICKQDSCKWACCSLFSEHYLSYIKDLLALVVKNQDCIQNSVDLPCIKSQLGRHYRFCQYISELEHNIGHAQAVKDHLTPDRKHEYRDYLAQLDVQYNKLVSSSDAQLQKLMKLNNFTTAATKELMWISDRTEKEMKYDWSDNNTNMTAKKDNFSVLRWDLEQRKESISTVQATGNKLLKEGHPAQCGIKALITDLQTQWSGLLQLCCCIETHLKENTAYFQFFADVNEAEEKIKNIQQTIKKTYMCDHSTTITHLEHLLENVLDKKEQLYIFRTHLDNLIGRSKNIVQLKPRHPAIPVKDKLLIEAACDCKQIKISLNRGDKCMLLNNSHPFMWTVGKKRSKATVPSVYFIISPPNEEAIERSSGLDASWQKVMSFLEKLHEDIKNLLSWQNFIKDIEFTSQDYDKYLKNLEDKYHIFISNCQDSSLHKQAELMYNNAIQHCNNQLQTMNQGEQDEPEPGTTTLDRSEDASSDGDDNAGRGLGGSSSSAPAFAANLTPEEEGE
ncbi:plectin-like isoform X16, partial [Clarias magur]